MRTYADIKNHEDLHYAVRNGVISVKEALAIEAERALIADKVMTNEEEDFFEDWGCFEDSGEPF